MRRSHLITILAIIAIGDGILIGAVVGAATRSPVTGLIVGGASGAGTWGIITGAGTMIVRVGTWAALWRRYPAPRDEPLAGPGSRVISLALGHPWWQINNAIEARADDTHLHLRPAIPVVGDPRPIAIPWEAVRTVEHASFGRALLDVEGTRLWLPRDLVKQELTLREAMAGSGATVPPGETEGAL